jgi:hypothetical protein
MAVKVAAFEGLKVSGVAFASAVLAGQLSKAGLNSLLVGSSEYVIKIIGPKAAAFLVNALRSGKNIYGAAAMKHAAKLLRSNVITRTASFVLLSSVDISNIFRGRISGGQLFKNLATTGASIAGGTAGWAGGTAGAAALGAAIGSVVPGLGTIIGGGVGAAIGGIAGAIGGGTIAGKATNALVGIFVEDDANVMTNIIENVFKQTAEDYLLSRKECENLANSLKDKISGKTLKDMFALSERDRSNFAFSLMQGYVERLVSSRPRLALPSKKQMTTALSQVLEEMADSAEHVINYADNKALSKAAASSVIEVTAVGPDTSDVTALWEDAAKQLGGVFEATETGSDEPDLASLDEPDLASLWDDAAKQLGGVIKAAETGSDEPDLASLDESDPAALWDDAAKQLGGY